MKIEEYNSPGICFVCKNRFERGLTINFYNRFFNGFKLCKKCALELKDKLGEFTLPKSPKNICSKIKNIN